MKLFTPGPVTVKKYVLETLSQPILFHRTKYFEDLYAACCKKLLKVFGASNKYRCLIMTGSGTLALEAAITSCFKGSDTILIASNGHFAERLIEIVKIHNLNYVLYKVRWAQPFDLAEIVKAINKYSPNVLMLVGMETSIGMRNPVCEIGKICRQHKLIYFVDAVSALVSEDINVIRDNVDVCVSVANKGIESVPGVGLICLSPRVVRSDRKYIPKKSMSLDLWKYLDYAKQRQTPFTPAVSVFMALDKALDLLFEEGILKRRQRYAKMSNIVLQCAVRLQIHHLINTVQDRANAVNSLVFPNNVDVERLQKYLFENGMTIWYRAYKEPHLQKMAQISVMGAIKKLDIEALFDQIEKFIA